MKTPIEIRKISKNESEDEGENIKVKTKLEKVREFYDNELENIPEKNNKHKGDYAIFIKMLFGEGQDDLIYNNVLKLKDQITYKRFLTLKDKATKNSTILSTTIKALENSTNIAKYKSFHLTVINWLEPKK